MTRFEELSLAVIPMEKAPPKPERLMVRLVHLKSGAKHLSISVKARTALGNPAYVQVLADKQHIAIRAAKKDDPHARPVTKTGSVLAIELVRAFQIPKGSRMQFAGDMDQGHLLTRLVQS